MTGTDERHETLLSGELKVMGRIRSASNATFLCEAQHDEHMVHCVYKPVAGEQPLWDFPDGTLAGREYSTYLISAALGWDVVPHTILRDGPAGTGMVQLWVDQADDDEEETTGDPDLVDLCPVDADDSRLRRMAVFDVIVNNADRKGGHILAGLDGQVYGVDHGLALHVQDKLRTVLWGWAGKPIDDQTLEGMAELEKILGASLGSELREHITAAELAALRRRVRALLDDPVMPNPDRSRPIPWPAF